MNDEQDRVRVSGTLPRSVIDLGVSLGPGGARNEDGSLFKLVDDLKFDTNDENDNGISPELAAVVAGALVVGGAVVGGGIQLWNNREKINSVIGSRVREPLAAQIQQLRARLSPETVDSHSAQNLVNEDGVGGAPGPAQIEAPAPRLDLDTVLGKSQSDKTRLDEDR